MDKRPQAETPRRKLKIMWRKGLDPARYPHFVEVFALRAREYSDEVARLGEYQQFGQAFLDAMAEVNRRRVDARTPGRNLRVAWIMSSDCPPGTLTHIS